MYRQQGGIKMADNGGCAWNMVECRLHSPASNAATANATAALSLMLPGRVKSSNAFIIFSFSSFNFRLVGIVRVDESHGQNLNPHQQEK